VFEKDLALSALFDLYAPLLSDKKQKVFEAYYCEDLSLAEIALQTGTSRQAVREMLFRTAQELKEFESSLALLCKRGEIVTLLEQIAVLPDEGERRHMIAKIKELI